MKDNINYIIILILLVVIIYNLFSINYNIAAEEFTNSNETFLEIDLLNNYKSLLNTKILIKKVHSIFEVRNIRYWIHTDILLGAIKYKKIIPWDDIIDFCILEEDEIKLIYLRKVLKNKNLGIVEWFCGYKIYELDGINIEGQEYKYPFINILTFKKEKNDIILKSKSAQKLWNKEIYHKDDIFPLKLYDLEDSVVYGPNKPENILDKLYKHWKNENIKSYQNIKLRTYNKTNNLIEYNVKKKPYLWQYWDNIDGKSTPSYISLCLKTVDVHCSNSFEVVRLNKDNIYKYIPEIKKYKDKMEKLIIAHKVDIYRILLLHKYGGLYIDADTICLRDPIEIIDKLDNSDFVGFGCTGDICKLGYGMPSNWILASRPNSILISRVLKNILNKLENKKNFDYHDLGKLVIWEELQDLLKNHKYNYFHYPNKIDGSRDRNGYWIDSNLVFSNKKIEYEEEDNMMFYVFYNHEMPNEVKSMNEKELIQQDWNYSKFLRRSLKL
jgi:phosphorylcholine metabolism protein LicD